MLSCCMNELNEHLRQLDNAPVESLATRLTHQMRTFSTNILDRVRAHAPSELAVKSFLELLLIATAIVTMALV